MFFFCGGVLGDVAAEDRDFSVSHWQIAGYHVHGSGLTGTVGSEKSEYLIIVYSKADVVHGSVLP